MILYWKHYERQACVSQLPMVINGLICSKILEALFIRLDSR